jgi:hypothetical protein
MTTPPDVRSFAHTETPSGPSIRGTGGRIPLSPPTSLRVVVFQQARMKFVRVRRFRNSKAAGEPELGVTHARWTEAIEDLVGN